MKFFRKIRQAFLTENRFGKYLIYAVGEIVLVVIGILIAIQIDDWNRDRELQQEELDSYQLVIADLKRDSALFGAYQGFYERYLNTYFQLNALEQGEGTFKGVFTDFLVSNIEFNPVTRANHRATIEKLRNVDVREQINNYFRRLSQVQQATIEFNELVTQESRPLFLKEQEILNNEAVFDYDDRTFPPFKGVSTVDTLKLRWAMSHPYFLPILSQLRMSMGFYLASLERSIQENRELIQTLEKASG